MIFFCMTGILMEKKQENNGEKKNGHYLRREFSYSKFEQTLLLPDDVDKEKIAANVSDGVLTIDGAQGDISVYNIGGVRLANGSERLSVTLSKGVYIVTLNGKATKVIVK